MSAENRKGLTQAQKNKIGNWLAIAVLLVSILVPVGLACGSTILFWFLIIANCLFGPCCLIGYFVEVKRGVFKYDANEGADSIEEGQG